jgi:4-amino-4-deoxy-L-arabinose transferase-like glycosyltransferase
MFGIHDTFVLLGFAMCIGSTLLCLVYGMAKWNSGSDEPKGEDAAWVEHEIKIDEKL